MTFSYYPGCTLKTKAKDLNRYAYKCAEDVSYTHLDVYKRQKVGCKPFGILPQHI